MNKKFLSAILFGALMVTSAGTFVSCKDYDDDIKDLQTQINKLATKEELSSQIATLDAALKAAAANAATAIQKAEGAEKAAAEAEAAAIAAVQEELAAAKAELEEMVGAGLGTNTEALTAMNETVKAVEAKVTALVGEVSAMVTSVDLFENYCSATYLWVNRVVEQTAVFGDKTPIKANENLTFTAGTVHAVESSLLAVRVSPTNAVLKPENISLIDSEGNNLNDYLEVANVYPYGAKKDLYSNYSYYVWNESRAAEVNKTGLWLVSFKLKETADIAAFEKAIVAKVDKDAYKYDDGSTEDRVRMTSYALAVKNTVAEEGAAERNVVSGYGISFRTQDNSVNANLGFYVDETHVTSIRNRWWSTEAGYNDEVAKVQELRWKSGAAVAAVTTGDKINVDFKVVGGEMTNYFDARDKQWGYDLYPAVVGKPMTIRINDWFSEGKWYEGQKIAGFYVTLDKANALESAPSELNAWNSYEYENVGTDKQAATMFKGNTGTITIKNLNNVMGDVIGFRVYAVNIDGTLIDPDGRAFYVSVGEAAAETQTITTTITPEKAADNTVTVDLTADQTSVITSLLKNQKNNPAIVMAADNAVLKLANGTIYDSKYTVEFIKDKDGKAVKAKFTLCDVAHFIDGKTYKASIVYKNATDHVLGEVKFELTKTMPTAFPEDFAFRPKQEVTDGSGKFIAYMIPENGYNVASENGVKDLNNVFYGLNNDYQFKFATSALNAKNEVVSTDYIVATPNAEYLYELKVAKKFIDNTEWHAVTVNYLYRGVSTYYDATAKDYKVGQDHPVPYAGTLEAKYACWEDASAFAWGTYKQGTTTLSYKPALQWTAEGEGETANLSEIWSTNSYNNDYFGLDLNELINVKGWLNVAADTDKVDAVKLVVNGQVDPYFVPTIEGGVIKFAQKDTQVDAAPTADHEETLIISVVDAYGHVYEITLPVTVKAPAKK